MNLDDAIVKAEETLSTPPEEAPAPVAEASPAAETAPEVTETAEAKAERVRDEAGRFAKGKPDEAKGGMRDAQAASALPAKGKGTEVAPPAAPAPLAPVPDKPVKIPQSLRGPAKELAAKLPPEFHPLLDEFHRRDVETTRALNESHQARQFATEVQRSLSPYEGIARASGTDTMTWAGQALQERAAVMSGPPDHAVKVVANAVRMLEQRFGPQALDMINAAMGGQAPQAAPPPVDVNAQVEKALEARISRMQQQQMLTQAQAFVEGLPEDDRAELPTLMPQITGILEAARSAGAKMTYQQAYDQARWAHPEFRQRLIAQAEAEKAQKQTAAAQQAKAAVVSIKSTPAAPVRSATKGIDAAMEQAAQKLGM